MKTTAHTTNPSSKPSSSKPFFNKSGEGSFFSNVKETEQPFFSPSFIQPKLTIGRPNDGHEKEANNLTSKMVQGIRPSKSGLVIQKQDDSSIQASEHIAQLYELARTPHLAHKRWPKLNTSDRRAVFISMTDIYDARFALQFWGLANSGQHDFSVQIGVNRFLINCRDTDLEGCLRREGWRLRGIHFQIEYWVHPTGQRLRRIAQDRNRTASTRPPLVPPPPNVSLDRPNELNPPQRKGPSVGDGSKLELEPEFEPRHPIPPNFELRPPGI